MDERFIMAGRTPLHICDTQNGERCVVLLHGYLESLAVWEDFVPLLKNRMRVVTLDLPGHGVSVVEGEIHTMDYLADTVAAAMEHLGIGRYSVVGHSMGGYVAMSLAERYAARLDSIVLMTEDEGVIAVLNGMIERRDMNRMLCTTPVRHMFVLGRHDGYIPTETAEAIVAAHPEAEVVWLDHSGHMGFIEEPERCAEAVIDFICK